ANEEFRVADAQAAAEPSGLRRCLVFGRQQDVRPKPFRANVGIRQRAAQPGEGSMAEEMHRAGIEMRHVGVARVRVGRSELEQPVEVAKASRRLAAAELARRIAHGPGAIAAYPSPFQPQGVARLAPDRLDRIPPQPDDTAERRERASWSAHASASRPSPSSRSYTRNDA